MSDFKFSKGAGAFGVDEAFGYAFRGDVGDDLEEVDVAEEVEALEFVADTKSGLGIGDGET